VASQEAGNTLAIGEAKCAGIVGIRERWFGEEPPADGRSRLQSQARLTPPAAIRGWATARAGTGTTSTAVWMLTGRMNVPRRNWRDAVIAAPDPRSCRCLFRPARPQSPSRERTAPTLDQITYAFKISDARFFGTASS